MALTKGKLGSFIELRDVRNSELKYGVNDVRGVNTSKQMMPTKADLTTRDLSKFQIVSPEEFVFNHRTSRNGSKFSIAFNDTGKPIICTEDYVVFRISDYGRKFIVPEWLYMYFNRPEFDRFVITNSWGSSTEFYNWEDICDVDMALPPLSVQQKYVDIYNSMLANQRCYERGLEDLKLTCDGYVESVNRGEVCRPVKYQLGDLIIQRREKYDGTEMPIRGVSREGFIEPKQEDADLHQYNQFYYGDFVFNPARMEINSIALNVYFQKASCSSLYEIFYVSNTDVLLPEYLDLLLKRNEFARWCQFAGWGSAREYCRVDSLSLYSVQLPPIEAQSIIVEMYRAYRMRKTLNEQLKSQIKTICPILIRGSLEEGKA